MGWKLPLVIANGKVERLSENQCGMETQEDRREPQNQRAVEREPMWDGNVFQSFEDYCDFFG